MLFSLRELIDQIEALLDDGIDWTERPVQLSLRDAENRAFGKIEQLIDRSRPFVPAGQYLRRGVQQLAQQGFVADDLAVVTDCLLYTSDAADERSSVDLGGRRIIK